MKVIGHRGALHEALENSFSAFDRAVEGGADRIEFDIQLIDGGDIIVMHDDNTMRTTNVDAKVSKLSRQEAEKIPLLNGEPIPFLDEVVERYLDKVELNIEIKNGSPKLVENLGKLLHNHKNREKIIISSFEAEPLALLSKQFPELPLACLIGDFTSWPLNQLSIPLNFMNYIGTNIIHPWIGFVDENFMDQAVCRGWTVYPYSDMTGEEETDREGLWTMLVSLGVDGLCSNYPRELRKWITSHDRQEWIHKEAGTELDG